MEDGSGGWRTGLYCAITKYRTERKLKVESYEKEKIWRTGVKVYEYMAPHSCHTKAVLIDDRMSIVGSYNLDMRSTYLDTELMLAVDSTELNAIIRKEAEHDKTFSKTMENGKYTYGENYKTKELSTGKKLFYATLRQIIKPLRRFL